jgi:hypothetical protein
MEFEGTVSVSAPDGDFDAPIKGAIDAVRPLLVFEMDLDDVMPGLPAGGGRIVEIFDGKTIYMQFPADWAEELGGKRWVRIDAEDQQELFGFDLEALYAQAEQADPTTTFEMLSEVSDDVEEVGTETIDGIETRHFTFTLDMGKVLEQMPDPLEDAIAQAGNPAEMQIPTELWIDGDGYPRRLRYEFDFAELDVPDEELAGITMSFELRVKSYGKPVEASIPDQDDTIPFSELYEL